MSRRLPAGTGPYAISLGDFGGKWHAQTTFTTNPDESYWNQLQALQSAFQRDWQALGRTEQQPILHGLLKLENDSMTWNSNKVPTLNLVLHSIDSCTRTSAAWQRQRRLDFEDDGKDVEGTKSRIV